MFLGEKITYILFYGINNVLLVGFWIVIGWILALLGLIIFSIIFPPFLSFLAAHVTVVVLIVILELILVISMLISNIRRRTRDPYEPFGKVAVIIQELPVINMPYEFMKLANNPFSSKVDTLSY